MARIKNDAQKNEVADPAIVIERLKKENAELRAELAMIKGGVQRDHLDPEDIDKCGKLVDEFIASKDPSATIIVPDKLQINQCFYHFKHMYLDMQKRGGGSGPGKAERPSEPATKDPPETSDEVQRLRLLVKQRDNEILILVGLLNKGKGGAENGVEYLRVNAASEEEKAVGGYKPVVFPAESKSSEHAGLLPVGSEKKEEENKLDVSARSGYAPGEIVAEPLPHKKSPSPSIHRKAADMKDVLTAPINIKPEDVLDRAKAFDMFRKNYRRNEAMEENKALLREKFTTGKNLGLEVNTTRKRLKDLTNKLEDLRKDNARRGMVDKNGEIVRTEEEDKLQNDVNKAKELYQKQYGELKDLKADIERIQALLERSKDRMQKDFEQWFGLMMKQCQSSSGSTSGIINPISVAAPTKSIQTGISTVSSKDPKVNASLAAFYKSRDEIYQTVSKANQGAQ